MKKVFRIGIPIIKSLIQWRQRRRQRLVTLQSEYIRGKEDGIRLYAWWKDGIQYVGTTGWTLKEALEDSKYD